ncbi:MAG TPA: Fe(2+) transporter permease subunit FeoB [Gammaproteobacteria bacterium]|nr:Fe(2+) transporter permease subunit FeoB [Gammaproteobacteria bacterium]
MPSCCESKSCCNPETTENVNRTAALAGNPNCGKTTLFNALTGARQRIGNWPGVTVEKKCGTFYADNMHIETIDLPGIYSLMHAAKTAAIDERIAADFILASKADVLVNIVDASNLERHLYLTMQLIEMGAPIIVALNMMDVARAHQIKIDIKELSQRLGCPVIALEANKGEGVYELKREIARFSLTKSSLQMQYPQAVEDAVGALAAQLNQGDPSSQEALLGMTNISRWQAVRLLENDASVRADVSAEVIRAADEQQQKIRADLNEDADVLLASTRYQLINDIVAACVTRGVVVKASLTSRIDNIVLNRVLGIPIFLAIMYALFFFSINIGGAFQDFFDISSETIFVNGFAALLTHLGAPTWLIVLLANGLGKGINTTITFIPVIGAMFLFLAFLEDSGYMARAAFVVDRLMRALGLPGKAFVPMIVGFGCNVPAVMGARTLENKRDRILTIMMSPFMSCGARLAIFAVFTAAFFPQGGQNIIFALYLIGILMAVMTGFLLRSTVLKGDPSPLVMELPQYHVPHLKTLFIHAWQRLNSFVTRAGRMIVPVCILIGALNSLNLDGTINTGDGDAHSLLSLVGQYATVIFHPMGIQADNWPATVGLVTGVLAKEVVVGSLNTLYTQLGHFAVVGAADFQFWAGLKAAVMSIPDNFAQLGNAFSNPVLAKAPIDQLDQSVYGLMYQKFDGKAGAFAYLLFILLYFPCISTMAAILRELHRGWGVFSGLWMTGVAYGTAVMFYQAATWTRHPAASASWIAGILAVFFGVIFLMRWYAARDDQLTQISENLQPASS